MKKFFADNYYDIRRGNGKEFVGEDEFANINITIENLEKQNDTLKNTQKRLKKQRKNPYFGRFDFTASSNSGAVIVSIFPSTVSVQVLPFFDDVAFIVHSPFSFY